MRGSLVLWIVVLASPVIWFASQLAGFAIAPLTCTQQSNLLLWLVSGAALILDAVTGYAAWRSWQYADGGWLALSGVILSSGFFLVIIAQALPTFMLAGCQ
jgi:hypothetical protein